MTYVSVKRWNLSRKQQVSKDKKTLVRLFCQLKGAVDMDNES